MLCETFEALLPQEKTRHIGELLHAVQSSDALFEMSKEIIRLGRLRGLFEGVTILPEGQDTRNDLPLIN